MLGEVSALLVTIRSTKSLNRNMAGIPFTVVVYLEQAGLSHGS